MDIYSLVTVAHDSVMNKTDAQELRRRRLRRLIADRYDGVQARFIDATGLNSSLLSRVLSGIKPFGEKLARTVEEAAKLEPGYLDTPDEDDAAIARRMALVFGGLTEDDQGFILDLMATRYMTQSAIYDGAKAANYADMIERLRDDMRRRRAVE